MLAEFPASLALVFISMRMFYDTLYARRFALSCISFPYSIGCMRVLDRHIFLSLTAVFFLALSSLLLLFFSVLILRYSRLISEHHQFLSAVVATCIAGIPMHVSFFVPPASGVATFLCMRGWQREGAWLGGVASGYGVRRWRAPFLLFAVFCCLVGWLFTLWLGPYGARVYFARVNDLYADRFFLSTEPKRFVKLTDGVTLWVESKPTQDDLRNLVLTIKRAGGSTIIAAQSGRLLRSESGLMFEAHNGTVSRFDGSVSQTTNFQRLRYGLEELLNPPQRWQNRLKEWTRLEIPTPLLLKRIARVRQADADSTQTLDTETLQQGERARREFVLRLAYPLLAPVYVLAIFALCVPTRARSEGRNGLAVFSFLILYSTAHIYAITLAERGGWATAAVFALSAAVAAGAYALATRKSSVMT